MGDGEAHQLMFRIGSPPQPWLAFLQDELGLPASTHISNVLIKLAEPSAIFHRATAVALLTQICECTSEHLDVVKRVHDSEKKRVLLPTLNASRGSKRLDPATVLAAVYDCVPGTASIAEKTGISPSAARGSHEIPQDHLGRLHVRLILGGSSSFAFFLSAKDCSVIKSSWGFRLLSRFLGCVRMETQAFVCSPQADRRGLRRLTVQR